MSNDIFKKAAKQKIVFISDAGVIRVEDLWDLNLESIDSLAKSLDRALSSEEKSFIGKDTVSDTKVRLKFDIVKAVIADRLADIEAAENRASKKAQKELLLSLLADKENEELKGKSKDEIREMLDKL
jgi:hypothetical protein